MNYTKADSPTSVVVLGSRPNGAPLKTPSFLHQFPALYLSRNVPPYNRSTFKQHIQVYCLYLFVILFIDSTEDQPPTYAQSVVNENQLRY